MSFIYNMPNMPDYSSFMEFADSVMSDAYLQNLALHAEAEGPSLESMTADSVALTEQAEATALDQALGYTDELDKFSQHFTKDDIASYFGVDPNSLSDEQAKTLTELLYNLNEVNAERAANGEEPLSNDEINQYLSGEIEKFKNGEESPLGKTLSELGINGLSEEQFNGINEALDAYNVTAAKEAEEAQKAQQTQSSNETGGSGGTQQTQNTKQTLPEKLGELQQLKNTEQGELGSLKNELAGKKGEINELKGKIAEGALGENATEDEAKLLNEYNKAKADYNTANTAKQTAQTELTAAEQKATINDQELCSNAQQRSANDAALASAQSELASLKEPQAPKGEDKDGKAQAAYNTEKAQYDGKKRTIEAKIQELKNKQVELDNKRKDLEAEKQKLTQTKADKNAEIQKQDAILQDTQGKMDESMAALSKNDKVKNALNSNKDLKKLESEVSKLEKQISEKESRLAEIDAKLLEVEAKDEAITNMRQEEAAAREEETDQAFQKSAEAAGLKLDDATSEAQNKVAADKYNKAYADLTDEEKQAIENEVDGQVTITTMEAAKEKLKEDPDNQEAKDVLAKGQENLEAQRDVAFYDYAEAYRNMPADMQAAADKAALAAVNDAQKNGTDPKVAYFDAIAKYANENAEKAEGDDAQAAMKEVGAKTGDYVSALENCSRGESLMKDNETETAQADPAVEAAAAGNNPVEGAEPAEDSAAVEGADAAGDKADVNAAAWEGVDLVQGAEDRQAYVEQMNAAYSAPLLEQGWKPVDVKNTGYDMIMKKGDLSIGVKWGEVGAQNTEMFMHGDGGRPVSQKDANPFEGYTGDSNLVVFQVDLGDRSSSATSGIWSSEQTTQKACEAIRPFVEHGSDIALSCHSSGGYGGCSTAEAILNGQAGEMKDGQNLTLRLYDAVPRTEGEQRLDKMLGDHPNDFNLEIYTSTQGKEADEKRRAQFMSRATSDEQFLAMCQRPHDGGKGGLSITGVTRLAGDDLSLKHYNVKVDEYDSSHGKLKNFIAEDAGFSRD